MILGIFVIMLYIREVEFAFTRNLSIPTFCVNPDVLQIFSHDLAFPDDVALLSSSISNAKKLLKSIEKIAATVGLFINLDKTEYIMVGDWKIEDYNKEIKINEGKIKLVTDFKYLGSWVMSSGRDFEIRKESAWKAALSLKRIWKSKILSRNTILRIFLNLLLNLCYYIVLTHGL